jgi:excinuclease UvrABC ATPase subunit
MNIHEVVVAGTPEGVVACEESYTGRYLRLREQGLGTTV